MALRASLIGVVVACLNYFVAVVFSFIRIFFFSYFVFYYSFGKFLYIFNKYNDSVLSRWFSSFLGCFVRKNFSTFTAKPYPHPLSASFLSPFFGIINSFSKRRSKSDSTPKPESTSKPESIPKLIVPEPTPKLNSELNAFCLCNYWTGICQYEDDAKSQTNMSISTTQTLSEFFHGKNHFQKYLGAVLYVDDLDFSTFWFLKQLHDDFDICLLLVLCSEDNATLKVKKKIFFFLLVVKMALETDSFFIYLFFSFTGTIGQIFSKIEKCHF